MKHAMIKLVDGIILLIVILAIIVAAFAGAKAGGAVQAALFALGAFVISAFACAAWFCLSGIYHSTKQLADDFRREIAVADVGKTGKYK